MKISFVSVQEIRDRSQFRNGENFFGRSQVMVGYRICILSKQVIYQNFVSFAGKYFPIPRVMSVNAISVFHVRYTVLP